LSEILKAVEAVKIGYRYGWNDLLMILQQGCPKKCSVLNLKKAKLLLLMILDYQHHEILKSLIVNRLK
jgi:hypothetical protein